jgi:hypothetical protein
MIEAIAKAISIERSQCRAGAVAKSAQDPDEWGFLHWDLLGAQEGIGIKTADGGAGARANG